jgi:hypothetical protein
MWIKAKRLTNAAKHLRLGDVAGPVLGVFDAALVHGADYGHLARRSAATLIEPIGAPPF